MIPILAVRTTAKSGFVLATLGVLLACDSSTIGTDPNQYAAVTLRSSGPV